MKIKSLRIKNFRSIKDDLIIDNIGDTLILTGENNSGKSSIINALAENKREDYVEIIF